MFSILLVVIYLSFVSLGLPDPLLGAAWPNMYKVLNVPLASSGIIYIINAIGAVISSLCSDRLTKRFGCGKVTLVSTLLTAISMVGFATSNSFYLCCLWSIPYGLGAGGIDAALNNYVALHYESRHMSWLHCMWGLGTSIGPLIMSLCLANNYTYRACYAIVGVIQFIIVVIMFLSLPLWKKNESVVEERKPTSINRVLKVRGVIYAIICFFCYCAIEGTAGLWTASFLNIAKGIDADIAASTASLFYIGITIGRAISGFVTLKLNDRQMVRTGETIILLGVITLLLPINKLNTFGFIVIGLGCAPIYPCMMHLTPKHFGDDKSQAVIGLQMVGANLAFLTMPPLFGVVAEKISIGLLPYFLLIFIVVMFVVFEILKKKTGY